MIRQFELIDRIKAYDPEADETLLNRAYVFSMKAHGSQVRASGDPYFLHPLEVAGILTDLKLDCASVVTGLLHDTVEDTIATLEDIRLLFGDEIAQLVDGVTKLSRIEFQSEKEKQAENFRKLVMAMSSDIRVLLVKLADRLHNMRTLHFIKSEQKRKRIATETLEIFAPLAGRIGMSKLKDELEDLAFITLFPEDRKKIIAHFKTFKKEVGTDIDVVIDELRNLSKNHHINAEITGREKTPYSIWSKMRKKNINFDQMFDLIGYRILVDEVADCYGILGLIHRQYKVVPGRFKDFISIPKQNGYQSIHTTIIGPRNHRLEIQIRTTQMHFISEYGVAAHWQYKQDDKDMEGRKYAWIRGLLEVIESAQSPEDLWENTKFEMYQDHVFCFTPKGDLISLPNGATAIDFAYAVHSQVGDSAVAVKINGYQMPLKTILSNGDQVEIVTQKKQSPSPLWEQFVVTGKAKSKIRKFVQVQQNTQFQRLGESILENIFKTIPEEHHDQFKERLLNHFHLPDLTSLHSMLSHGDLDIPSIKAALQKKSSHKDVPAQQNLDEKINIEGLIPGMAIHFSECCHPVSGDSIIGVVSGNKGMYIHVSDCEEIKTYPENLLMPVRWSGEHGTVSEQSICKKLKITFLNQLGSLARIINAISSHGIDIVNLKVVRRTHEFWEIIVDIQFVKQGQLSTIFSSLRTIAIISSVEEIKKSL